MDTSVSEKQPDLTHITSNPASISVEGPELTLDQKYFVIKRLGHAHLESLDDLPAGIALMLKQ